MKSLIITHQENKYLLRYKVYKSVVNRKHTNKEGKVTNRLEIHPNSVVIYLYKLSKADWKMRYLNDENKDISCLGALLTFSLAQLNHYCSSKLLTYIGKGLSKCSDKDTFYTNTGILQALKNLLYKQDNVLDNLEKDNIVNRFVSMYCNNKRK